MSTALSSATPAPLVLPRARALTDALLCPPAPFDIDDARLLSDRLARTIEGSVTGRGSRTSTKSRPHRHAAACVRICAYQLLSAGRTTSSVAPTSRFHWTARRARRAVGLAALRKVLDGTAGTPTDAVLAVLDNPRGTDGLGTHRPGSCAEWLDSLSLAARAGVRAEATTWATQLTCALEWERVEPSPSVGQPDRWWVCGDQVRVALRGRADVHLAGAGGVHLSMIAGHPSPESRMALCLSALVELLSRGPDAVPSRAAGVWPEAGKAWIVPVDAATLSAVADAARRAAAAHARFAMTTASTR